MFMASLTLENMPARAIQGSVAFDLRVRTFERCVSSSHIGGAELMP